MSSAYLALRTCASRWAACSPAQAAFSASRASLGLSLSWAAEAVSPMASAAKNFSAAGPGPWGRGVQPDMATTASSSKPEVAEANVVLVTIVADVKNCDGDTGRDTPRPNRYAETRSRMEHHRENRGQKSQPRYARDRSIEQGADRKHQQT
ncbi:Uncharacterised protein [Mycobacterium tuberculosis]|uniref:Uncharacterized protein n=2 Tax=Mycobacterium tuberculosis TaxID=1773 RepID=A0A654U1C4_MYCTX|nr:Uncharacterised protein [Mycobacterium tuberculosis]CKP38920.1 Uncharacterised protein [Mycobacterium tuberculosis]CKR71674.1 Uncharacterised protein [Mycobacterium tuberculosis]CKT56149.1 Uncharacterised protein [Mycobacterium tuberculosis]CKU55479.1 Uncharacterised protein [Mycobacterium tuberculosis]